ncbi:MAG: hypothetical protein ABFD25_20210 [Clostridiaceae bacterium]
MKKNCPKRHPNGAGSIFVYPAPKRPEISANRKQVETDGEIGMDNKTERLVEGFDRRLAEDGKRPKTVESYVGNVGGFLEHII